MRLFAPLLQNYGVNMKLIADLCEWKPFMRSTLLFNGGESLMGAISILSNDYDTIIIISTFSPILCRDLYRAPSCMYIHTSLILHRLIAMWMYLNRST